MKNTPKHALAALCLLLVASIAAAQYSGGYGDYYRRNIKTSPTHDPGDRRFLYDKYYYRNPNISPYLSSVRGGTGSTTSYYNSVLPEQRRREAAKIAQMNYIQQRKRQGNVGHTAYPGANFVGATPANALLKPPMKKPHKPNAYYNRLYGNRYLK